MEKTEVAKFEARLAHLKKVFGALGARVCAFDPGVDILVGKAHLSFDGEKFAWLFPLLEELVERRALEAAEIAEDEAALGPEVMEAIREARRAGRGAVEVPLGKDLPEPECIPIDAREDAWAQACERFQEVLHEGLAHGLDEREASDRANKSFRYEIGGITGSL